MSKTDNPLNELSEAMVAAVEKAGAATVLVDARKRFPASGIAIAADLILTADHVVERDDDIKVLLPDGTELAASLAGRDPGSDLAVLRLERPAASPAEAAPEEARVGQLVLALGRPSPEGIQASLGVVSAIGGPVRTGHGGLLERYLRTDATPYPGFSGGPLVDTAGRVVGLNTSGLGRGAALTIPAALAWGIASTLAKHGHVRRGFIGVRSQPVAIAIAQQKALGASRQPACCWWAWKRRARQRRAACWWAISSSPWRASRSLIRMSCWQLWWVTWLESPPPSRSCAAGSRWRSPSPSGSASNDHPASPLRRPHAGAF